MQSEIAERREIERAEDAICTDRWPPSDYDGKDGLLVAE
jgi:hypothetical protein